VALAGQVVFLLSIAAFKGSWRRPRAGESPKVPA
jgi:hypothetical protein